MTTTTRICCLLLLAASAVAQGGTKKSERPGPPDGKTFRRAGLVDDSGKPVSPEAAKEITAMQERAEAEAGKFGPPELSDDPIRGDYLFKAAASSRPRRLAAGETGVLHVVVTLSSTNVVLPGSRAEIQFAADTGPLKFGAIELVPPTEGKLETYFKGSPVHEDSLVFKVPVTVQAGTKNGRYEVNGNVVLALHDGPTGTKLGDFYTILTGSVKVGASLGGSAKAAEPRTETAKPNVEAKPAANTTDQTPDAGSATTSSVHSAADTPAPSPNEATQQPEGSATPAPTNWSMLLGLLGLGIGAMIGLLWLRRD